VGLRVGLGRYGKSRPPPGFDPRTVQPVGSRYTDFATPPVVYNVPVKRTNKRIMFGCCVYVEQIAKNYKNKLQKRSFYKPLEESRV